MKFTKMQGIGNDYIYVNCFEEQVVNPEQLSVRLSDRRFGIGGDGLILIMPSQIADFKMRIFNADGSEAMMCGNGTRCIGKYVYEHGLANKPHITLELGRGIAACCGRYYTHIVDIKHNKGQNYLLIDGGMHHLVYFGQHMAMKHPFLSVCDKEQAPKTMSWNICGSLCSMNDIVAKQVELPEVSIGDTICFENTGAYCMTEGISLFLSREIPAVYLMDGGDPVCVRQTFDTAPLNTPD